MVFLLNKVEEAKTAKILVLIVTQHMATGYVSGYIY